MIWDVAGHKAALALVTTLLLVSQVAFLAVPLLLPLHVWAAHRSGRAGAIGWGTAAGLGAGMTAWAAVYVSVGERQPVIWLVPLTVAVVVTALVARG